MRTDADLQRAIEAELAWDPAVKSTAIGVAVNHGVVSLSGHIDTYAEKWAVEKALRRVPGVKAIAMELDVKLSPEHRYNDTELADAAETALVWHTMVPTEAVRVTVDNGRVTLEGEVDWDYQRRAVENAIRPLRGVVDIHNRIRLRNQLSPADLQRRLEEALTRQALREVKHLNVDVRDGTVTLRGTVHSLRERDAVVGTAWSAPGVRAVINELHID
jgi:osmotically-inducible protein OsmY